MVPLIVIAARDTSACLLGAAFFELARRPDVQAKLRSEIGKQLEGRLPTYDDFKNMTYLSWFMKEGTYNLRHIYHPDKNRMIS